MVGAYLYLSACSIKNRVRRRLRRLREPRYLIGTLVGAAYLYFIMFRQTPRRSRMSTGVPESVVQVIAGPLQFIGSVVLLVVALAAWVVPGVGRSLTFSRAEVQFLFTAPVTRRALLHYKLLRSQLGILFGSVIATVLLRPGSFARGWTMVAGLWLMLVVIRLHLMGVALSRRSLAQHGGSGLLRQWLPASIVVGVSGVLAATVAMDWPRLVSLADGEAVFAELRRLGSTGAAGVVLAPFRALVRLPLSASTAEFWQALPPVLALLALNYAWVLRSDAAFEEASAAHAEQAATRQPAVPRVGKNAGAQPFVLSPVGRPELAILWKNLIQLGRFASARTMLRVLPLVIVLGLFAKTAGGGGGIAAFVATLCIPVTIFTVLLGPQMLRNDLRQDLGNLAQLKTWPVSGPALVRGSVLGPTVVLSVVSWALILLAAVVARRLTFEAGTMVDLILNRASYATGAALVAPAVILSQTVIHNALAVLFPAWVAVGASRARGIDAMGQRLLMLGGIMLTLAFSVIPGALLGGAIVLAGRWLFDTTLVILPAAAFAAIVIGECWVATEIIGRVLARTDITAIDAAE
ncbi:MAG: putative ABC exporter domain-containing protein [Vicinamibacterales bacterium]|nr:putative ABC exporter domain-containing protein [Vicinamibacterales bacterium]